MGRHEIFNLSTAISTALLSEAGSASDQDQSDRNPFADPNRHEGFIPYPPGKPICFMAIDVAIPLEAKRLIELADGEIRRLLPLQSKGLDLAGRLQVQACLEAEYRIRELTAVAAGSASGHPADSDEVGRAIDAHRAACASHDAACKTADRVAVRLAGGDVSDAAMASFEEARSEAGAAEVTAWESLLSLRPVEPSALARMIRYVATSPNLDEDNVADVLNNLAAAAEALIPRAPAQGEVDPVLALIEEHQAAYEEWDRLDKVAGEFLPPGLKNDVAQAAAQETGRREREAFDALMAAQPSTLPGLVALADYLPDAIERLSISDDEHDAERALRNVTGALRDLVKCGSATSGAL